MENLSHDEFQEILNKNYEVIDERSKETVDGEYHMFQKVRRKKDNKILVIFSIESKDVLSFEEEDVRNFEYWWPSQD